MLLAISCVSLLLVQSTKWRGLILGILALGLVHGVLATLRPRSTRGLAWFLLLGFCAALVVLGIQSGWVPIFVGGSFFALVFSGLVVGRWALFVLATSIVAGLVLEGYAVGRGWLVVPMTEQDPSVALHWVRTGFMALITAMGVGFLLRYTLSALRQVHAETVAALLEAREEAGRSEATRIERAQQEHALLSTQKLRTVRQLAGGLAHHFNNHLTVVCGALDTLSRAPTVAQVRATGHQIVEYKERGTAMLKGLMAFSRRKEQRAQRLEIGSQIEALGTALRGSARDNTTVVVELAEPEHVEMDADVLHQLLYSVALNAFDALPDGGKVHISARHATLDGTPKSALSPLAPGAYVALRVEDNGEGMSADTRAQAALPFFTTKDGERHLGLGLSTVFGAARAAGGALAIESELGVGTVVTIYLPASPEPASSAPPAEPRLADMAPSPTGMATQTRDGGHASAPTHRPPAATSEAAPHRAPGGPAVPDSAAAPRAADLGAPSHLPRSEESMDPDVGAFARWEEQVVRRLLQAAVVCLVLGSGVALLTQFGYVLPLFLLGAGLACWGAGAKRTHQTRVVLLQSVLWLIAAPNLVHQSYLAAATLGLAFVAVAVAGAFGTTRALVVNLVMLASVFVVGGSLCATGVLVVDMQMFGMGVASNWYRIAVSLGLEYAFLGLSVLLVFERGRDSVFRLLDARHALEVVQTERETEVKQLMATERMLAVSSRLQVSGRLSGAVAHDLGNAMQVVVGCAWELQEFAPQAAPDADANAVDHDHLAAITEDLRAGMEYATGLVAQFDFGSQLEAQQPELPIDLSGVVARAMQFTERSLRNTDVSAQLEDRLFIRVHTRDVQRVLMNLLQNAKHAVSDGGRVSVRVRAAEPDHVELVVEDTGCGMSPETQEKAFDTFFTTREAGDGTGLGLNIVQEVVNRSQGELSLDSELGRGTRVTVRWPRQASPPTSVAAAQSQHQQATSGTALLAEDHAFVRPMLARALSRAGFKVIEACDGDEACALLAEHDDIDILCVDAVMPGCPTKDIIAAFRAHTPNKPVVLCSGHLPEHLTTWGLMQENIVFIAKPVDPSEYARVVRALL